MTTSETETLRAAIEAALRRRYGENTSAKVSPLAHDSGWHSVRSWAETGAWPMLVHATTRALPTEIDALHALAAFVGLRDNGSDPTEEVERLRAENVRLLNTIESLSSQLCDATRERDEARADAARAREAYAIDLAGLRDTLRRADDLRVMWRERVADVASERDALRAELEDARAEAIESERRLNAECSAMDDRDEVYRALRGADDGSDDIVALAEWRMSDLAATRAALRANLRCDECEELATRAHADTARFGCDAHGVGEGWADTAHAAAVRAALR